MGAVIDESETTEPTSNNDKDWHRVSPIGMFATLGVNPLSLLYVGVTLYVIADMSVARVAMTAAGIVVALVLVSAIMWLNFSYQIGEDGVRIKKGVFKKSQVFIRYARVQGVELTSTLLYRAMGLVLAKLDTAGAAKQEGVLPGIAPEIAELIQTKVKAAKLESQPQTDHPGIDETPNATPGTSDTKQLLQLQAPEIIRIGLTSSHVFLFLGFLAAIIQPLAEFGISSLMPAWAVEQGFSAWSTISASVLATIFAGMAMTTVTAMFAGSLISAFLRFFNFTLTQDDQQLRTNAGLFTVREQSVHQSKVQTMTVRQSLPRRLLNRVAIDLHQATGGQVKQQKKAPNQSKLLIPLTEPTLISTVREFALGGRGADLDFDRDSEQFASISPRYLRARSLLLGVLPLLVYIPFVLTNAIGMNWFLSAAAIWIALVIFLTWLRYRRWGVQAGEDTIAVRQGYLGYQITCFACEKVQSIDLTAHLFQERAGVANLTIHLASQKITIPYLPRQLANDLRNYLLYKIESSNAQTI